MQGVFVRPESGTSESSSDRRVFARISGAILLVTLVSIVVLHGGPASIAGQRVSGTSEVTLIRAFYSHPSMVWFWWQGGISLLGLGLFAAVYRGYLSTFEQSPIAKLLTDAATGLMFVEVAVLAAGVALQAALVQLVSAAAPDGVLLSTFAAWDWLYNGFTYWFEFAWMFLLAGLSYRARALPSWVAGIGWITSAGLLFNSTALFFHIPDSYTLIPTAFFIAWFLTTSVYLLRGGTDR